MNSDDYREILQDLRRRVPEFGLGNLDDRIMSGRRERTADGDFQELISYLQDLRDEIQLGSDEQYREVMRRIRENVGTTTGEQIDGIRIQFSESEGRLFDRQHLDLKPSPQFQEIAAELTDLITQLKDDHEDNRERRTRL